MIIKYVCRPFELGSVGEAARGYIRLLSKHFLMEVRGSTDEDSAAYYTEPSIEVIARLLSANVPYDTVIHHMPPLDIEIEGGAVNIGIVAPKTTKIPTSWITVCNALDLIIAPSEYCRNAIATSGVYTPIFVCAAPIDSSLYTPSAPLPVEGDLPSFRILTMFNPTLSSNWIDATLAYLELFTRSDDVVLIVKSNHQIVVDALVSMANMFDTPPLLYSITTPIHESTLPSLYSLANLFYLPARGKAFGVSYFQALACGIPVVCTDTGGHVEYLDNASFATPSTPYPAASDSREAHYNESLMWRKPHDILDTLSSAYTTIVEGGLRGDIVLPNELSDDLVEDRLLHIMDEADRLRDPVASKIGVSIIILSYNNLPMLSRTLETLVANTRYRNYEVIIVDNASDRTDEALFDYLSRIEYPVIYSDVNLGFGGGNNLGASKAVGNILLFLNNDTEPQPSWLDPIVKTMRADPEVGIVGSKLLFPNMTIQHVGIAFKQPGGFYTTHPYYGYPSDHDLANIKREMLAVTGACFAIRRDVFKTLGGFDHVYERGYYEDSDLCFRAREAGHLVVCDPDSVVIHKCGSSFGKLGDLRTQYFFIANERTFRERWEDKVLDNAYMFTSKHHYAPGRKSIAILDSSMATYGGGEKEVACVAKATEEDANVDIVMRLPNSVSRNSIRKNLGVNLRHTELVTLVSAEPIELYRDYDVFWNNEWRSSELGRGKYNILRIMFPMAEGDLTFIDTYDKLLANSEYTRKWIYEYWGADADVLYPPVTPMADPEEAEELADSKNNWIITVGRFFPGEHCKKHMVMIDAFRKLQLEGWELHVVGGVKQNQHDIAYYEACKSAAAGFPIVFHTNTGFDELKSLYRASRIYWHATGYEESDPICAEHFGIAPVEAMSAGCYPVLIGKGGLVEIAPDIQTWDTIDELIDITRAVADSTIPTISLTNRASSFSEDKFTVAISELIEGV